MDRCHPLDRRTFLKLGIGLAAGAGLEAVAGAAQPAQIAGRGPSPMSKQAPGLEKGRMPILFVGHGSPMNAIEDNEWSRGFRSLGEILPRPRAILAISAHWYVPGTHLTGNERPRTIHDFGGFPDALFRMQYPAPGDVALAERVVRLIGPERASLTMDWGIDHGTWTVLHHLRPDADCPVVQLSIDEQMPAAGHVEIGSALAPLRDEGVLVMGSGNIVHNLRDAFGRASSGDRSTPAWASDFDAEVARAIEGHDRAALIAAIGSDAGAKAHPTPDHYLPLLYAAGAADPRDVVRFPIVGFDMGSLSMRSVLFG